MKKIIISSMLSCILVCTAGCENKQDTGLVTGGVAGGLVGSLIGGGTGKVVATGVGALAGSIIGSAIGKNMDKADQLQVVHHLNGTTAQTTWVNTDTGYKYHMVSTSSYHNQDQELCKKFYISKRVKTDNQVHQYIKYGTACQQSNGLWKFQ